VTADRLRDLAVDLLGALRAAHRDGIIHRDVKPGNVLITHEGRAKLADFGIAKTAEGLDLTATGLVVGTPTYLAPERLSGLPATPSTDLYSLGIVLYEAATGEKPYQGETPVAIAHQLQTKVLDSIATRRPELDRHLVRTIDGAVAKDPSRRFKSAAEMLSVLRGDEGDRQADQTMVAPRPMMTSSAPTVLLPQASTELAHPSVSPNSSPPHRTHRNPRTFVAWGAALLVAIAVIVIAVVASNRSGSPSTAPLPTTASAGGAPLPPPLEVALRNLESTVKP
jgi:serine/threonine-protein kinase